MRRFIGTIKGRGNKEGKANGTTNSAALPTGDSPQAVVVREVTAFCESGAPNSGSAGDEYLHLPAIVDAAESSPAAATEAAQCIRRYLSKNHYSRGYAQYNAIMLLRILTDNPARAFTRNMDAKFILTTKELLRDGKDQSVQQILRETLDYFEMQKLPENDTLRQLVEMWRKEKAKKYGNAAVSQGWATSDLTLIGTEGPRTMRAPPFDPNQPPPQQQQGANYYARQNHRPRGLPRPEELAARIEEAKTTARLLLQTLQSTPSSELMGNELVKEFAERATAAQRSIQGYMNSENPAPDEDTMLTLIETSDQLNIASSKYQRALLQARKSMSAAPPPPPQQMQPGENIYAPTPQQPRNNRFLPQLADDNFVSPIYQPPPDAYLRQQSQQPNLNYTPPPGPPPGAVGAVKNQEYGPAPPLPNRTRPLSQNLSQETQSAQYGVADNPFADPTNQPTQQAPSPPQQPHSQQTGYSLFSSAAKTLQGEQPPQQSFQPPTSQHGPYNGGYQPTPSYINRQESSVNNLTMHGASSPPDSGAPTVNDDSMMNRERGGMRA